MHPKIRDNDVLLYAGANWVPQTPPNFHSLQIWIVFHLQKKKGKFWTAAIFNRCNFRLLPQTPRKYQTAANSGLWKIAVTAPPKFALVNYALVEFRADIPHPNLHIKMMIYYVLFIHILH